MIGQTIHDRYRILRLLGEGGMGAVYEAEHTSTHRHVAIKLINSRHLITTNSAWGRFQREARAIGGIESQHIVQVLDSGTDTETDTAYLVMEQLKGEDLQQLLDRVGVLPPLIALRIVAQACAGLQRAHYARVVHRDLKPAKLFLARGEDGEILVKLLDFGIAKMKTAPVRGSEPRNLTPPRAVLGSPLYMSPEQAEGLKHTDHRTDIWSLGAVLYTALAGRAPHAHLVAMVKILMAVAAEPPRPIQEIAPWVPREVAAVVHGALRMDVWNRFQSATSMLDAIKALLPDGSALRADMLTSLSEAERAVAVSRLDMSSSAPSEAPRPVARVEAPRVPTATRLVPPPEPAPDTPSDDEPLAAPVFLSPPHLTDASGALSVWITQPLGLLMQVRRKAVVTGDMARLISQEAYGQLVRLLGTGERAFFVYDLALMTHYETEARTILTQWGVDIRGRVAHIVVRPPPQVQRLARMGVQTVVTALGVIGVRIDLVAGIEPFMREHNLRPRP